MIIIYSSHEYEAIQLLILDVTELIGFLTVEGKIHTLSKTSVNFSFFTDFQGLGTGTYLKFRNFQRL